MALAVQEKEKRFQSFEEMARYSERFSFRFGWPIHHAYLSWLNSMKEELPDPELKQLCFNEAERFRDDVQWLLDSFPSDRSQIRRSRELTCDKLAHCKVDRSELPQDLEDWNEERLERVIKGWSELFQFGYWYPEDEEPFFAVLSRPYLDLPRQLILGPEPYDVLQRQFDRIYVLHPYENTTEMLTAYYDHLAPIYESEELIDPFYKKALIQRLCDETKVNIQAEERILDLGVGTGFSRFVIPADRIYGVDFSEKMCFQARRNGIRACQANAEESLPFIDDFFDASIASYTAHCFQSAMPYAEMKRVLKDGARVAFNLYKPEILFPKLGVDWREEFATMLTEVGLTDINFSIFEFQSPTGQSYQTDIISAKT